MTANGNALSIQTGNIIRFYALANRIKGTAAVLQVRQSDTGKYRVRLLESAAKSLMVIYIPVSEQMPVRKVDAETQTDGMCESSVQ